MEKERDSSKAMQDSHTPHGSIFSDRFRQLIVFANMRALVVFPTPRGPQKRYACASWFLRIEFLRVFAIFSCPISVSKLVGLYFLAETINLSIPHKSKNFYLILHL